MGPFRGRPSPSRAAVTAPLAIALLLTSCATKTLSAYAPRDTALYDLRQERSSLVVAVEPLSDAKQCKSLFGADLVDRGVLPLLIVIENRSEQSYLLERRKIEVGVVDPRMPSPGAALVGGRSGAGSASAVAGTAVIGAGALLLAPGLMIVAMPLLFGGLKMESDATVVKNQILAEELRDQTLSPGETVHGFVYLPLEGIPDDAEAVTLALELAQAGGEAPERYGFEIPIERRK